MSFQIIAIQPLKECNTKFLRTLKEDVIYKLNYNYEFIDNNNIKYLNKTNSSEDLYNIQNIPSSLTEDKRELDISISAIVGCNGSGKSSLVELLYVALYNFSVKFKILERENEDLELEEDINVEIFYEINHSLISLKFKRNTFYIKEFVRNGDLFSSKGETELKKDILKKQFCGDFFYSLVINYSLHSLNSRDLGVWVEKLFHKNDSYQTPIVLNPLRREGNIDINSENYLARSRFMVLLFSGDDDIQKKIIDGKEIKRVSVKYKYKGIKKLDKNLGREISKEDLKEISIFDEYIDRLFEIFFGETIQPMSGCEKLYDIAEEYLIRKLILIPHRYITYKDFRDDKYFLDSEKIEEYFKKIHQDRSHITLKIRQTLNFIKYQNYIDDSVIEKEEMFNFNDIKEKFQLGMDEVNFMNYIEYVFPPFFEIDYLFDDQNENHSFSFLSSGEKQKVFTLNTLSYHLRNIVSVMKNPSKGEIFTYKNINLILDEIELYYHPNFQKSFISDLRNMLRRTFSELENIELPDLNIIFITHSPFILSDIPQNNILYLNENGEPISKLESPKKSFGANISDLLADSFFLNDGLIGDFAKQKINDTIKWINELMIFKKTNPQEYYLLKEEELYSKYYSRIIEIIDEPFLKEKLAQMYDEAMEENLELDLLEKQKDLIESKIKKLKKDD